MKRQYQLFLLLVSFVGLISSVVKPTDSLARNQPYVATTDDGGIALPGSCTRVTPGNGDVPTCCVSGYVWMDGQAIRGATVTITAPNGRQQTLITDVLPDSDQPYYRTALTGEPLNVQVGQTITIAARYSSHEQTVTHVVRSGGQQVDLVLAKTYTHDYMFERQIWGQAEAGAMNYPYAIATAPSSEVYVLDSDNARVQVFDNAGRFLRQWGTLGNLLGQFDDPRGIAVDSGGDVYVLDTGNYRVQKFSSAGAWITSWGNWASFSMPVAIAVGPKDIIYVFDPLSQYVQKFDSSGEWLGYSRIPQHMWGYNFTPNGIAVDNDENMYVSDTLEDRIFKLNASGNVVGIWGGEQSDNPDLFNTPTGITVDRDGYVYVSDTYNNRIQKLTKDGAVVASWGTNGSSDGQFINATGVASHKDGYIYVVDPYIHRVQKFTSSGDWILTWGSKGRTKGQFSEPGGIVLNQEDNILVLDTVNYRVQELNKNGNWVATWGEPGRNPGQFLWLNGIVVDGNDVYISDGGNHRIHKFRNDGTFLQSWGGEGAQLGQLSHPSGIAFDSTGTLFVTDGFNHRVQKFSKDGTWLGSWGSEGDELGQFDYPRSITFDEHDHAFIVDGNNHRVQKLDKDGNGLQSWPVSGYPYSIARDSHGLIYVGAGDDVAIQRFDSNGTALGGIGRAGSGLGEFENPQAITVGTDGKLYIADEDNNRIQILRPMQYTRPVGTITWLSRRSLVQGQDTLTAVGRGADSDEDGAPSSFIYRWYRGDTLLGTGATLSVAASSLPVGTYDLSLEVVDDEGEVSTRVSTPIDVSPPPQTAWTFLLYLVADSYPDGAELLDAMDGGFGKGLLARLQQQQRTTPNAQVQVVVQIDAYGTGNTRRLVLESNGTWREVWRGERAMDDADTLADFVRWGKQEKPASHYALTIASHGNGYQGVAWDDTSGGNSYLTMAEIGQALENASGSGAAPVDVLHLDACSMGLLDVAYELRDQVRYLVVSQNLGWSFFLQDRYRSRTGANTTPRQLAEGIVTTYADYAELESRTPTSRDQYPYTVALLDLRRAAAAATEVDELARELGAYAVNGTANRGVLATLREQSQKFDSPVFDYHLTVLDEYVDLVDWAERVRDSEAIVDPAVKTRATNVINAVRGTNGLVVAQRNSGAILRMPQRYGGQPTNLSGAHGISVYYPHELSASVSTTIWYRYKNDQLFQFTGDTQWNEFLRAGNIALPAPTTPQAEPGKPGISLGTPWSRIFIPFATR